MSSTIPSLDAGRSGWRYRRNLRKAAAEAKKEPPWAASERIAGIVALIVMVLVSLVASTFLLAAANARWGEVEEGIAAVALEGARLTKDKGQVAMVAYEYEGVKHEGLAPADGGAYIGDTVVISVERATGEPVLSSPNDAVFCIIMGCGLGVIVGILAFIIALMLSIGRKR